MVYEDGFEEECVLPDQTVQILPAIDGTPAGSTEHSKGTILLCFVNVSYDSLMIMLVQSMISRYSLRADGLQAMGGIDALNT